MISTHMAPHTDRLQEHHRQLLLNAGLRPVEAERIVTQCARAREEMARRAKGDA